MFRRVFLLLLILLLPLKSMAAGVVALVGMPGHTHATQHGEQFATSAHAYHADCSLQQGDAPSTPMHDHACPHLGMVSIVASVPVLERQRAVAALNVTPAPRFSSVVHDVPSPIPLAVSVR